MDFSRIIVQFHDGQQVVDGTITQRLTPRRLVVNGVKVTLARTVKMITDGLGPGFATIEVSPQWEQHGEDFPAENVFKFDDEYCWTVQGHRHSWVDVEPKYIEHGDDEEVE